MSACSLCGRHVQAFGATRCNTETCYLETLAKYRAAIEAADAMRDIGQGLAVQLGIEQRLHDDTLDALHEFNDARADYFMARSALPDRDGPEQGEYKPAAGTRRTVGE